VLSLEQALSMTYATLRFACLGWRVIKLEPTPAPGQATPGDPNRYIGQPVGGPDCCSYFVAPNAGKEAMAINLKTEEGRAILHRLVRELPVDVFCCNTLPARYRQLGIDFETLQEHNPKIIWAGISAYGPGAPQTPGYDPAVQAATGHMAITGDPQGPPMLCGTPLADLKAGDEVFAQTMLALAEQAEGAGARRIDVSMARAAASWLITTLPMVGMGAPPDTFDRAGNEHRQFVPVNVYPTRDGHLLLAVGNDVQWQRLTGLDAFKSLANDVRKTNEGRKAERNEIHAEVAEVTRGWETVTLVEALNQAGIVACAVCTIPEVLEAGWLAPLLKSTTLADGTVVKLQPSAVQRDDEATVLGPPPRFGQDTVRILGEAGAGADEVQAWREAGIVYGVE
jgi:crotonobetainyl-CoA:carnitine CoA-transferase CaiB-like acyl-CoA transferase